MRASSGRSDRGSRSRQCRRRAQHAQACSRGPRSAVCPRRKPGPSNRRLPACGSASGEPAPRCARGRRRAGLRCRGGRGAARCGGYPRRRCGRRTRAPRARRCEMSPRLPIGVATSQRPGATPGAGLLTAVSSLLCPAPAGVAGASPGMDRPRTLSAAGRSRRIGPAGAALLLILLAGACAQPSVPPPPAEGQPPPTSTAQAAAAATERPAPEAAAPEREDQTLSALSADESDATPAAREPAAGEDDAAVAPEATLPAARVGLLLPLSGRYASEGETLLRAAQLALFDTADERFLLLPRDTEGTAKGAERAALALLEDGVDLILGPLFAEGVNAIANHARARNVTVVAFSTDRAAASEGVYLLGHTPRAQIRRVFAHARGERPPADRPAGAGYPLRRGGVGRSLVGRGVHGPLAHAGPHLRAGCLRCRRGGARTRRVRPARPGAEDERRALARQNDAAARRRLKRLATLDTLGTLPFDAVLLADGGARLRQVAPLLPYYDIDPAKIRVLGTASGKTRPRSARRRFRAAGLQAPTRRHGKTSWIATAGSSANPRARSPPLPMTRPRWRLRSRAQAPRSSSRPLESRWLPRRGRVVSLRRRGNCGTGPRGIRGRRRRQDRGRKPRAHALRHRRRRCGRRLRFAAAPTKSGSGTAWCGRTGGC